MIDEAEPSVLTPVRSDTPEPPMAPEQLSGRDARDALERQLRRLPGIVAVSVTHDLVRVALDPNIPKAVDARTVGETIRRLLTDPLTIELAVRPTPT